MNKFILYCKLNYQRGQQKSCKTNQFEQFTQFKDEELRKDGKLTNNIKPPWV